ncbi:hypothetical protein ACG04Q_02800 [Roseateles sp. DXS20W]|uniref:ABC transporter permease n=1 Tax=Pelomonas lactea TaxID=3299030 RepID=A0ABW7GEV5_9BURK
MHTHIPTLLQREWMQHKRGWLITALAPPLLFLAVLPFSDFQGLPTKNPELMSIAILLISVAAVYVICLLVGLFQLPGLARRDTQDRSIEFWLSLPGRPAESVLATVLAHAWLAPLGGALIGALLGLPIAVGVLGSKMGLAHAMGTNWGEVIAAAGPVLLRGLAGTFLLTLWLAPFFLLLMAASSWLKRLGVPVVLVGVGVTVAVLYNVYDITWPLEALQGLNARINQTLIHSGPGLQEALKQEDVGSLVNWALKDFGHALADLASLQFLGWAAIAAGAFTLVVMKRTRGG